MSADPTAILANPDTAATPKSDAPAAAAAPKAKPARLARALVKIPKGTRDTEPWQMRIRERIFTLIKGVFQKHGAVAIDTPVFELKETLTGKYGEDSKLIYDLADQGGEILALRYDLTVPFARFIASHAIDNIKRYHIARVYRRDNPAFARGRFREFYQCDFDIAGKYGLMIPDSECIAICDQILSALNVGGYAIKINHRKLIDAIMSVCGVPEDKYRPVCSAIDKLDKEPWAAVKAEMIQKGLTEACADQIGTYVTRFKGAGRDVLDALQKDATLAASPMAQEAFTEMTLLFEYTEALACYEKIVFDLSLARGLDYYTGIIYEAVLTDGTSSLGSIAAGGRYDSLVGMFSAKDVPAVGISIGIERIFAHLEEQEKKSGTARKNDTEVFVMSTGANFTKARMAMTSMLWKNDIKAEFLYDVDPKPAKQMTTAVKNQIPIVVILGDEEEKEDSVSVKVPSQDRQFKVKKADLIQTIRETLAAIAAEPTKPAASAQKASS